MWFKSPTDFIRRLKKHKKAIKPWDVRELHLHLVVLVFKSLLLWFYQYSFQVLKASKQVRKSDMIKQVYPLTIYRKMLESQGCKIVELSHSSDRFAFINRKMNACWNTDIIKYVTENGESW